MTIPRLQLPFSIDATGAFVTLEQDTRAEVAQSVAVLLGTLKGQRSVVPDYGVVDPTFSDPQPDAIVDVASQWEPRALVNVLTAQDQYGNANLTVRVDLAQNSTS